MSAVNLCGNLWIGGEHGVAILGNLRFWADNGLVKVEDARDNSYTAMSVREALERVNAISEMLGNSTHEDDQIFHETRASLQSFVEKMTDVCRKAREQGTPDDPSMVRDRMRRKPTSVVVNRSKMDLPI